MILRSQFGNGNFQEQNRVFPLFINENSAYSSILQQVTFGKMGGMNCIEALPTQVGC